MRRINSAFENRKAFIPFITCGDPDLETTERIVYALEESGANLIELGIPFSDPTAEGPTIQAASMRALAGGTTTDKIFEMIARIRQNTNIPLAIMTYANVVFSYGTERFIKTASDLGIDALILPDVPFEEKLEFSSVCAKYNVAFISLIAPTSADRIEMIAKESEGFIYFVSSLGVTGVRSEFSSNIKESISMIRKHTNIPVAIGFGISNAEQAKQMAEISDGVIVGSAIVKIIEKYGANCLPYVKEFVQELVQAIS